MRPPIAHAGTTCHIAKRAAFTLVELLVVIGIIAVLIAILLPALKAARDAANTVACASNMRQMGQAIVIFSQNNGGRCPGDGVTSNPAGGAVYWQEVLSVEFFKVAGYIQWDTPNKPGCKLYCPTASVEDNPTGYLRSYCMNYEAPGGELWGNGYPGLYGFAVNPPSLQDGWYQSAYNWPTFSFGTVSPPSGALVGSNPYYRLGAKLSVFKNSSAKWMLWDSDGASDTANSPWPSASMQSQPSPYPAWSSTGGVMSFRHAKRKIMNVLFVDGHVEGLTFNSNLMSANMIEPPN